MSSVCRNETMECIKEQFFVITSHDGKQLYRNMNRKFELYEDALDVLSKVRVFTSTARISKITLFD